MLWPGGYRNPATKGTFLSSYHGDILMEFRQAIAERCGSGRIEPLWPPVCAVRCQRQHERPAFSVIFVGFGLSELSFPGSFAATARHQLHSRDDPGWFPEIISGKGECVTPGALFSTSGQQ
jgi:hypothetical protein